MSSAAGMARASGAPCLGMLSRDKPSTAGAAEIASASFSFCHLTALYRMTERIGPL